jgi:hypothetical protein
MTSWPYPTVAIRLDSRGDPRRPDGERPRCRTYFPTSTGFGIKRAWFCGTKWTFFPPVVWCFDRSVLVARRSVKTKSSLIEARGWTSRDHSRLLGGGRKMSLDIPFNRTISHDRILEKLARRRRRVR